MIRRRPRPSQTLIAPFTNYEEDDIRDLLLRIGVVHDSRRSLSSSYNEEKEVGEEEFVEEGKKEVLEQLGDDVEEVPADFLNELPYVLRFYIFFVMFCHLIFADLL